MKTRLLIVDSMNLLMRNYKAQPDPSTPDLLERVVTVTLGSMRRALKETEPTHAVCVFEGGGVTWRHTAYPAYKANREPTPELVKEARTQLQAAFLEQYGVPSLTVPEVEADDVAGTLALKLVQHGGEAIILSTDKDFCQLIQENLQVRNHFASEYRDVAWLLKKFGVAPERFRDLLAMMGDISDNIPGIHGIGPKTGAALLREFNTLEGILAAADTIKGVRGKAIREHREVVRLAYTLVGLKTDVRIGMTLQDMKLQ